MQVWLQVVRAQGRGETLPNTSLLQSKILQLMSFMRLVFLKILSEERCERLVLGFCCFVVFFENIGLDSILLGNLIKIWKCKQVIFSNLLTFYVTGAMNSSEGQIKETQGEIFPDILVLCFTSGKRRKTLLFSCRGFSPPRVENDIQNYRHKLMALRSISLLKSKQFLLHERSIVQLVFVVYSFL